MKRGALSNRTLLISAAIAGCALLAYALPRAHPAAHWNVRIDRAQSIIKAREITSALGVDTSRWEVIPYGETDGKRGFVSLRYPGEDAARRFTPVFPRVAFAAPVKPERVLVRLSGAGEVNFWEHGGYKKSGATEAPVARAVAESVLKRFVGPAAGTFRLVTDGAPSNGGLLFAWEHSGRIGQRFETTVDGHSVVKAELKPVYNTQIDQAFRARRQYVDWIDIAVAIVLYAIGTVLAGVIYVYWAVRRGVRHRFVFALAGMAVTGSIISWLNWGRFDERSNITIGDSPVSTLAGALMLLVMLILFYLVLCGATDAVSIGTKLVTLRSIFSRFAFNRRTGISIVAGLLCGPLFAAIPLWISSWHLAGSQPTGDNNAELNYSIYPALQAVSNLVHPAFLGLFGIAVPLASRYFRKPAVSFTVLAIVGTLLIASITTPTEGSWVPYLVDGAILFAAYRLLFTRLDLLAVLAAAYSSGVIWNAGALLLQPARSLHVSGITALYILAALVVCAGLVVWRGRELEIVSSSAMDPVLATSQRESLMTEFSIAHRVQQRMLPENPPDIPGCSIAASCHPAREVGGDLFDFLKLPDGRWTISVGDVSGKGVPASLYMTLTKGLLIATTQDSSDVLDIIAHVNGHIHAVTERKTFVTMALGAFDPETRGFDHVRAGHNPIVWRRPSENITKLLNAPGIGLGMVSDKLFRRAMRLDRLQLAEGDLLVFYSDGLTEAMNSEQEQFGEERLMCVVEEADGMDATEVREAILARVKSFLNGIPAQDDMTLVVLRVN